jgi:hypothetical protein
MFAVLILACVVDWSGALTGDPSAQAHDVVFSGHVVGGWRCVECSMYVEILESLFVWNDSRCTYDCVIDLESSYV